MTSHFSLRKASKLSKLDQSTRVVEIDGYYTIRPFRRTPGQKANEKKSEVWISSDEIRVKSSETSSTCLYGSRVLVFRFGCRALLLQNVPPVDLENRTEAPTWVIYVHPYFQQGLGRQFVHCDLCGHAIDLIFFSSFTLKPRVE